MKIFISYRRADYASSATVGRLRDSLSREYGAESVFVDVNTIRPGEDFRAVLSDAVNKCSVFLLMIGPQWIEILQTKTDVNSDFVVVEIESAIRNNKFIIPVLLTGAKMPKAHFLPEEIRDVAFRNAFELDFGRNYGRNIKDLIESLDYLEANNYSPEVSDETENIRPAKSHESSSVESLIEAEEAAAPLANTLKSIHDVSTEPAKEKSKRSIGKGGIITTAVACLLLISGLGFWHFGKDDKPSRRSETKDNHATVDKPVVLEFTDVTMGVLPTPDGMALSLLDSKGVVISSLELNGNQAEGQNIRAELFDDQSRWPIKLRLDSEVYRMPDLVLELADFTDSGNDRRRYNKSLKLDLRPCLVIDPIVQFDGHLWELPVAVICKHLYPENPAVDWKLKDEGGKILVLLPPESKFPLKAIFSMPHMEEFHLTLKQGVASTWNLQVEKKEVKFSGLGAGSVLKFMPDFDGIGDASSKEILSTHLDNYTVQSESFDEGRGSWKLPALDGKIEVLGVTGKWGFQLRASAKWCVVTDAESRDDTVEIGTAEFLKLSKLAQDGDTDSQYELGLAYFFGEGVAQNEKSSSAWFRMAAEQGDKAAQHNLALAYEIGRGVTVDPRKALKWYTKAALQKYPDSQMGLALCYQQGRGVTRNYKKAEELFVLAAAQGNAPAMYNLAVLYEDEAAGMIDKVKAVKLYRAAADQGHIGGLYNLAWSYENGEGGLEKNIPEAIKYYQKAAEKGSVEAKKALKELE